MVETNENQLGEVERPVAVGMIVQDFPPDARGAGFYAYYLSLHLKQRGFDVTVFTRGDASSTTVEEVDGIRVYRVRFVPAYPFHLTLHKQWLKRAIRNCPVDFDIWHFHNPMVPSLDIDAPKVLTEHGTTMSGIKRRPLEGPFSLGLKIFSPLYTNNERRLIDQAAEVTTVSEACANELVEYYDHHDVEVVYNGVDTEYFRPGETPSVGSPPTVLYTGAHHPRKELNTLLYAVKQVVDCNPEIRVVLTGTGSNREELIQMSSEMGIRDRVKFPGYVSRDRLLEYYQSSDIFVNPSRYEGLPTSVLEAMACGLPVVATDIPGHNELITRGENGLLVPPGDSSKLAKAISDLIADKDLQRQFAERSRATVTQKYDWAVIADRIVGIYDRVLGIH